MAVLSNTNIKNYTDKLAAILLELDTDLGTGSEASTPSDTAADLLAAVLALEDDRQKTALTLGARHTASLSKGSRNYKMAFPLLNAIDLHVGGLSDYALAQDFRLHHKIKQIFSGDPKMFFAPETLIGSYAVVDAGTNSGTLTPGTSLNGHYGKSNLVVKVVNQTLGAANLVLTLTCVKQDLTTETKVVTVTANSIVGASFDVGTHNTHMYVNVSAVTFTGGTNGDDVEIRSEPERTATL